MEQQHSLSPASTPDVRDTGILKTLHEGENAFNLYKLNTQKTKIKTNIQNLSRLKYYQNLHEDNKLAQGKSQPTPFHKPMIILTTLGLLLTLEMPPTQTNY